MYTEQVSGYTGQCQTASLLNKLCTTSKVAGGAAAIDGSVFKNCTIVLYRTQAQISPSSPLATAFGNTSWCTQSDAVGSFRHVAGLQNARKKKKKKQKIHWLHDQCFWCVQITKSGLWMLWYLSCQQPSPQTSTLTMLVKKGTTLCYTGTVFPWTDRRKRGMPLDAFDCIHITWKPHLSTRIMLLSIKTLQISQLIPHWVPNVFRSLSRSLMWHHH